MVLRHVGLPSSSEDKSDIFFSDLLGLAKSEPKILPLELSKAIFNIASELVMINYRDEHTHFEIFITDLVERNNRRIAHTCLEIADLEVFLEKCHRLGLEVTRIPKGDKTLTFIRDLDGNLFEIKRSAL